MNIITIVQFSGKILVDELNKNIYFLNYDIHVMVDEHEIKFTFGNHYIWQMLTFGRYSKILTYTEVSNILSCKYFFIILVTHNTYN